MLSTVVLAIASFTRADDCESDDGSLVLTEFGCVRGVVNELGRAFTSIPFATPPTPENGLRFANPIPPQSWSPNILDATQQSPACMQPDCKARGITCYHYTDTVVSEDCLYLSIYTPPLTHDLVYEGLPVMFWIHGLSTKQITSDSSECSFTNVLFSFAL